MKTVLIIRFLPSIFYEEKLSGPSIRDMNHGHDFRVDISGNGKGTRAILRSTRDVNITHVLYRLQSHCEAKR